MTIKFITTGKKKGFIKLNDNLYKPFKLSEIPNKFGFIYDVEQDKEGIPEWFNRGGLTYIRTFYLN